MNKEQIVKQLRDMAKHPTVTFPRDCEALKSAADLIEQAQKQEPVAWINWCAATGKRSVSFECESELASEPLYSSITQITQDHYSNANHPVGYVAKLIEALYENGDPVSVDAAEFFEQAQKPEGYQEPVAYGTWDTMLGKGNRMMMVRLDKGQDGCTVPLYTSPPQRQPLTDEQIAEMWLEILANTPPSGIHEDGLQPWRFARAIEAAHGIKE
jgi:hypothetical protein